MQRIESGVEMVVQNFANVLRYPSPNKSPHEPVAGPHFSQLTTRQRCQSHLHQKNYKTQVWRIGSKEVSWLPPAAVVVTSVESERGVARIVSLFCRLPFGVVITFDPLVRFSSISGISFSIPRLKILVSEDSPFLMACRRGNVLGMRSTLASNRFSWYEVAKGNLTPMYYAIESGEPEAVRFLLEQGADINETFGRYQTSPLAWALGSTNLEIARICLEYDANLLHISAKGWSPVFYLWDNLGGGSASVKDFLIMLISKPEFDLAHQGLVDIDGCSLLNRVSAMGRPDELEILVRYRADLHVTMGPLAWNPLQTAAFYGTLGNLQTLLPYYDNFDLETRDLRGWTLLHIAASAGHDDIVRFLLSNGADWQALSNPSWTHMPEELYGRSCTPLEVAGAQSQDRSHNYRQAVKEICGIEIAEEPLDETWHDAQELFVI